MTAVTTTPVPMKLCALLSMTLASCAWAAETPRNDGASWTTLTCSSEQLFFTHQGHLGALHLKTGLIANLFGKRDCYGGFYGGANFGWENQGGYERAKAAGQPYGLVNEWPGPARAIVSVAGNKVYFPVGSQVICQEGAP